MFREPLGRSQPERKAARILKALVNEWRSRTTA